jgi:hypothetical protein
VSTLLGDLDKRIDELIAEVDAIREEAINKTNAIRSEANLQIEVLNKKIRAYNRTVALERDSVEPQKTNSKMGCMRNCIQASGNKGATYRDIGKALHDAGFSPDGPYRYTVVGRWRKEGKITERGGRIYWATPPITK